MKERPILFNSEMVRAVLDGRKTMTRRVVKPAPSGAYLGMIESEQLDCCDAVFDNEDDAVRHSPYGRRGDQLWVRETFADLLKLNVQDACSERLHYRADDPTDTWSEVGGFRWTPSIHMPRGASRIQLEIVDVRIERLQDISRKDAVAEGGPPSHPSVDCVSGQFGFPDFSRSWFGQTWDSIYGTWSENPFVWVVEFKRVDV